MSKFSLSVIMNGYLDPAQVALGRLVLDMKNPGQNYCPFNTLHLDENDISKSEFLDLKSISSVESSSSFKLALFKVLQIFAEKSQTTVDDISTKTAMRHQLLNLDLKFESILEDVNVMKWLEKVVLAGQDVYLVVGLHTLEDASIGFKGDSSIDSGGIIKAPTITSGTPADIPTLPRAKAALDIKFDNGHKSKSSLGASFVAPGERIIAVQYQKVAFKMFSSKGNKSLTEAKLRGKTVWQSFGAVRGGSDLDIFEAFLAETTTVADIWDEDEFQSVSVGDHEMILIPI